MIRKMSTCMPLSDPSPRPECQVVTRLEPRSPRLPFGTGPTLDNRISDLEARLDRLESGQVTALDLVRRALDTLKSAQAEQSQTQAQALARLTDQLGECEAALARVAATQKRDDETMRERLFGMGEALEAVRGAAAAAVRPGALRKLERELGKEIETCAAALRSEMDGRLAEAVTAAEGRNGHALNTLENDVWDDMTELARRFDCLADMVLEARKAVGLRPDMTEWSGDADDAALPTYTDEEDFSWLWSDNPDGVPPQGAAVTVSPRHDVGAVLSAAARRVDAAEPSEKSVDETRAEPGRPARGVMARLGRAACAALVIGGLSLLAGPALGPTLEGVPPAWAQDAAWTPLTIAPQEIAVAPRLVPVTRPGGEPRFLTAQASLLSGR